MTPPPAVADAQPAAPPARPGRPLLVVFLVVATDLLGFGIVLPLVPLYAETLLKDSGDAAKGLWIGAIYSSFSLMQFLLSPVWGRVSDRVGRRPVLLVGLAGSVVFYALFGYASTLTATPALAVWLLLLSRVGAGAAGATVGTAAAVIADCTPPDKRAKGMALIGAAFGIGFTAGPLVAWAGDEAWEGALWGPGAMAAGLSAVALALAAALFPETLPAGPRPPRQFFSLRRTAGVLADPAVGRLVLAYFLTIFAFANFESTLALLTKDAFAMTRRDTYLVFAFVGLVLMAVQGGIYRPLAGRLSEAKLMTAGLGLMALGLGMVGLVAFAAAPLGGVTVAGGPDPRALFYPGLAVAVAGFAFVNPSASALISKRADPARQGEVLGVSQAGTALGRILGPLAGAVAFEMYRPRVLPYAVAAVTLFVVVGLLPAATREPAAGLEQDE